MQTLLDQQIDYYRARAQEYDEWFYRQGRYDRGAQHTHTWETEASTIRQQLLGTRAPQILEMACGTGIWTQELIKIGNEVTALDASPEMININRAKLQSEKVTYHQANLFQWEPDRQYDMVFFGFWLSHVPAEKLSGFLQTVNKALKPDGRLFIIDSRRVEASTAANQNVHHEGEIQGRILNDGREFQIVKIYYETDLLTATLAEHGFNAPVQKTPTFFIYCDGRKAT